MEKNNYNIGMVGLGVMGRNFVLNMADHGFSVVGYDTNPIQVESLRKETENRPIKATSDITEFISLLKKPRAIMVLVPAGAPVDSVIQTLLEHLEPDDLIIDGGNSYFKDTDVHTRKLLLSGIHFLGVGISGGEEGARYGPSIMPGGSKEAYARVQPIFEAAAAKVKGEPCVTWLGKTSSGHYVKMVHNGIEYGIMQLIAETYDVMKRSLEMTDGEIQSVYADWDEGELNGYLMEITAKIFSKQDTGTGKRLINEILGVAAQNGTGLWTSQSAMELKVPLPTIDLAVTMRDFSSYSQERRAASLIYNQVIRKIESKEAFLKLLQSALYASILMTYAQGFALLKVASEQYDYDLNLEAVAKIWRGGCIIRAKVLDPIGQALKKTPNLSNVLLDSEIAGTLIQHVEPLRQVVSQISESGISAAALMVSLSYLDAYRSDWVPANLIQAQRDYFGAHTYERIDAKGTYHTEWEKQKE